MSDTEEDVSDVELVDEFDDFDPLADNDEEKDDGDEGGDDDDTDADETDEEGDGGDDADDAAPRTARPPRRARRKEAAAVRQTAQAVGTRRIVVVAPEDRQTSNKMTLPEVVRMISIRAKQISVHPYAYTDVEGLSDEISIARKEFFDRRTPMTLERQIGWTSAKEPIIEMWSVREMSYPPLN